MGHLVELLADGRVEPRVAMAVDVAPQAGHAVEILAAVDVDQRAAVGPLDDQRLVLAHLGEGVPDDVAIPAAKLCESGFGGSFVLEHVQPGSVKCRPPGPGG